MKTRAIAFIVAAATLMLPLTACTSEETKTVDWYAAPENKTTLEAKLKECKNNPGELKNTPNCINAQKAADKIFLGGKFEKVEEPPVPFFAKPGQ